ncbi:hypothetical protein [Phenylobacterium zucineum]|uniref:hypothetical protein n=1 Tax=Phenylobacterium zucineum TaxID=284016 RepID=UPI0002FB7221|nr:hypothetical protein [Phenylobacterium zucineum]
MRRAVTLAAAFALAAAGGAAAETWTKFADGPNGTEWSYDADYTYKDRQSGRIVVMQAVSKPSANIGPSGPGKPDGVGYVYAIDCAKKNLITVASYKPSVALEIRRIGATRSRRRRAAPRTRPWWRRSARTRPMFR